MNRNEIKRNQIILIEVALFGAFILGLCRFVKVQGIMDLLYPLLLMSMYLFLVNLGANETSARLIRGRLQKGQYKNAAQVRKTIFIFEAVCGVIGTLLFLVLADLFCNQVLDIPFAALTMRILSPLCLILVVINILQSFFQGMGTSVPGMIAESLKVVFGLSLGVIFYLMMEEYGNKASALLQNEDVTAMYGNAGIAIGLVIGFFLSVMFLAFVYIGAGRRIERSAKDSLKLTEDGKDILTMLLTNILPAAFCFFSFLCSIVINLVLYQRHISDHTVFIKNIGTLIGEYGMLCLIPVALIMSMTINGRAQLISLYRKEEIKRARDCFYGCFQGILILSLFIATILVVLAPCITQAFFLNNESGLTLLLQCGGIAVTLACLGLFFLRIMEGIDKTRVLLLYGLLAGVIHVLLSILFLNMMKGNMVSIVISGIIATLIFIVLCGISICRTLKTSIEWLRILLFPLGSALVTGLILFLLSQALMRMLGGLVAFIVEVLIGILLYGLFLYLTKSFKERELQYMPFGRVFLSIGRLFHFL